MNEREIQMTKEERDRLVVGDKLLLVDDVSFWAGSGVTDTSELIVDSVSKGSAVTIITPSGKKIIFLNDYVDKIKKVGSAPINTPTKETKTQRLIKETEATLDHLTTLNILEQELKELQKQIKVKKAEIKKQQDTK